MRREFYYLFLFLFISIFTIPCFSATTYDSGSSLSAPTLEFKSWRAGRGGENQITFITSTETECWVLASVGYAGNLNRNTTAPITRVEWAFELTHEMEVAEPSGTSWTGSHPAKLLPDTQFWVLAKLEVPKHEKTTACTSDDNRRHLTTIDRTDPHLS